MRNLRLCNGGQTRQERWEESIGKGGEKSVGVDFFPAAFIFICLMCCVVPWLLLTPVAPKKNFFLLCSNFCLRFHRRRRSNALFNMFWWYSEFCRYHLWGIITCDSSKIRLNEYTTFVDFNETPKPACIASGCSPLMRTMKAQTSQITLGFILRGFGAKLIIGNNLINHRLRKEALRTLLLFSVWSAGGE